MKYHIGVVMNAGKPIVITADDNCVFNSYLSALVQKDTTVKFEQDGMCIHIKTSNIAKIITGEGENFNILEHL
jgi:hypothetical protein